MKLINYLYKRDRKGERTIWTLMFIGIISLFISWYSGWMGPTETKILPPIFILLIFLNIIGQISRKVPRPEDLLNIKSFFFLYVLEDKHKNKYYVPFIYWAFGLKNYLDFYKKLKKS